MERQMEADAIEGMQMALNAEREFWAGEATLHTFTQHAVKGVCQTCRVTDPDFSGFALAVLTVGFVAFVVVLAIVFRADLDHITGCGDYHTLAAVRYCLRTAP
jgi:hypothetical protein